MIQLALAVILTFILFVYGSLYLAPTPSMVMASGSAGTWLVVGYFLYLILIMSLAVTALLYNYAEATLNKRIDAGLSRFAYAHLILVNIGMIGLTWLLMYAGFAGGSALLPTSVGGGGLTQYQTHVQILSVFPTPIIGFIVITLLGMLSGLYVYWKLKKQK